jgi:hypothetical protein
MKQMESTSAEPVTKPKERRSRPRLKRALLIVAVLFVLLGSWIAYDLYSPRQTKMRQFDANEVARLETAMWRSYYSRQRVQLFREAAELLRTQYRLPFWRSNTVAIRAAKAAFVFKDGHNRAEYERALPDLVKFYAEIRAVSDTPFDVDKAAKLELEWWIIHRERAQHDPANLDRALAELQAEIFHVPAERLMEHAHLRAEAMRIRDDKAANGGVTNEDWRKIEELLRGSWSSLLKAVNS